MKIPRILYKKIISKLQENKVVLLYGPRRVGKTTILNDIAIDKEKDISVKFVNGENYIIQKELSSQSIEKLKLFCGNSDWKRSIFKRIGKFLANS